MPVLARQVAIGRDLADRRVRWHHPRPPQRVGDAPEMEMLQRPLRQVLPLGDPVHAGTRLDQHAGDAAQAKHDRERHADRPSADDSDPGVLLHAAILVAAARRFGQRKEMRAPAKRRAAKKLASSHSTREESVKSMRIAAAVVGLLAALIAIPPAAQAETYPSRP